MNQRLAPRSAYPELLDTEPPIPWTPPGISSAQWDSIEREALRVNERYLSEIVEGYAFCPFSRQGQRNGQTGRYVHRSGPGGTAALLELMTQIAAIPAHAVSQVILPLAEVSAKEFSAFCHQLTAFGNARMGKPVLACAPLHPELAYDSSNEFALVPLFRRAPDPTIQWVRLDGLESIYQGRSSGTICPSREEVEQILRDGPRPAPRLYERVAETNARMARRIGVERLAEMLREIADDARRSYQRVLLSGDEIPCG